MTLAERLREWANEARAGRFSGVNAVASRYEEAADRIAALEEALRAAEDVVQWAEAYGDEKRSVKWIAVKNAIARFRHVTANTANSRQSESQS